MVESDYLESVYYRALADTSNAAIVPNKEQRICESIISYVLHTDLYWNLVNEVYNNISQERNLSEPA